MRESDIYNNVNSNDSFISIANQEVIDIFLLSEKKNKHSESMLQQIVTSCLRREIKQWPRRRVINFALKNCESLNMPTVEMSAETACSIQRNGTCGISYLGFTTEDQKKQRLVFLYYTHTHSLET